MALPPYDNPGDPYESDVIEEQLEAEDEVETPARVTYRASGNDPAFGYLIAIALSIGLSPFIPDNTDLRYTIVWAVLAGFGVLAWLLGNTTRIEQETPENLAWGVIFGLIIGTPLLIVGGSTLATTAELLFSARILGEIRPLNTGSVLALLLFVQPLAETLFFRGVLQESRSFWLVGLLASLWSVLLFFPMLDVLQFPVVAFVIGTALVMMNLMYSYVRYRNGLAAAWLCQIVVNLVLLFFPFITG